jgi:DNA-binding MarR family transcriptional regulator
MESSDLERRLLEALGQNPDTTQATLAAQLGVAVGSVNWVLKRLIRKGYVKVTRLQRRKLKYFVTPQGLAVKAHLTSEYLKASLRIYRLLREEARQVLEEVQEAGYGVVQLNGDGEAAEIFRLTCLEQGVKLALSSGDGHPTVALEGTAFVVSWPEMEAEAYPDMDRPHPNEKAARPRSGPASVASETREP